MSELPAPHNIANMRGRGKEILRPEAANAIIEMEDAEIVGIFLEEYTDRRALRLQPEAYASSVHDMLSSPHTRAKPGDDPNEQLRSRLAAIVDSADLLSDASYNKRLKEDSTFRYTVEKIQDALNNPDRDTDGTLYNHAAARKAAQLLCELRAGQPLAKPSKKPDTKWKTIVDHLFGD